MTTLVAHFCATLLAAALCIGGGSAPYDPHATTAVYFYGIQVGVYEDDQQPDQCSDTAIERVRWALVIAAVAPGGAPPCPAATFTPLEWGQFWGPPPPASSYIIESATLGPLTGPAPKLTRQALRHKPGLLVLNP